MLIYESSVLQMYSEHTALSEFCNTIWQTCKTNGHTNNAFQLAMQPCCTTSWSLYSIWGWTFWLFMWVGDFELRNILRAYLPQNIHAQGHCQKRKKITYVSEPKRKRVFTPRKNNRAFVYTCPEKRNPSSTPPLFLTRQMVQPLALLRYLIAYQLQLLP